MPRETKKAALAVKHDAAAPFLFDGKNIPAHTEIIEQVRRYEHTGARLLEDADLVVKVVERLMLGQGIKRIAYDLQVSPHTIRAARDELVSQGKLAPFKERVLKKFEEAIEVGAENYVEALEKGMVPPGQIPVGMGIFFDKRALALGEPTSIAGSAASAQAKRDLSVEALNDFVAHLSDSKSGDSPKEEPC